mgnify:CR=1 FL=1
MLRYAEMDRMAKTCNSTKYSLRLQRYLNQDTIKRGKRNQLTDNSMIMVRYCIARLRGSKCWASTLQIGNGASRLPTKINIVDFKPADFRRIKLWEKMEKLGVLTCRKIMVARFKMNDEDNQRLFQRVHKHHGNETGIEPFIVLILIYVDCWAFGIF